MNLREMLLKELRESAPPSCGVYVNYSDDYL